MTDLKAMPVIIYAEDAATDIDSVSSHGDWHSDPEAAREWQTVYVRGDEVDRKNAEIARKESVIEKYKRGMTRREDMADQIANLIADRDMWRNAAENGSKKYAKGLRDSKSRLAKAEAEIERLRGVVRKHFEAWASVDYENNEQKKEIAQLRFALDNLLKVHEVEGGTKYHAGDIAREALKANNQ